MNPLKCFIDWWSQLDNTMQYGVPISLLIFSGILLLMGKVFIIGWALGLVLLLFSGKPEDNPF